MIQKIIRVGNSAAVTVNKEALDDLGLSVGDFVDVKSLKGKKTLRVGIAEKFRGTEKIVDKEVYRVAKDLLRRYLPAFKKLAKTK